jgi:hypothetical protein
MKAFQALLAPVAVCHQQHGDAEGMPDFEVVIRIADEKRASGRHAAFAHEIVAALDFADGKSVRDAEHEVEIVAQAELRHHVMQAGLLRRGEHGLLFAAP